MPSTSGVTVSPTIGAHEAGRRHATRVVLTPTASSQSTQVLASSPLLFVSNSPMLTAVSPLSRTVLQPPPMASSLQPPQTGDRPMGRSMSASLIQLPKSASSAPGSEIKDETDQAEQSYADMANCVCSSPYFVA